jgi:hypothetical protein
MAQFADLLESEDRATIRAAYGVETASEMAAMVEAFPCGMCFVPSALRPPMYAWPLCECLAVSVC